MRPDSFALTLSIALVAFGLSACTQLRVRSEPPEADVSYLVPLTNEKKFLSRTPFEIPVRKLEEAVHAPPSSGEFIMLVIEKKDYQPETVMVPVGVIGTTETTLAVRLKLQDKDSKTSVTEVLQHMVNAQEFIHKAQLSRANLELEKALAIEAKNPWAYVMRGQIYFLQRDYARSLENYEKSLDLEPNNQSVISKITELRNLLKNGTADEKH
jgi:tetratricopeptide (TPR) repeat protein